MVNEVINSEASSRTGAVVGMVLTCSLLANYLQRFNTSIWFLSDSILAIIIGFVVSLPFCAWGEFSGGIRRPGKEFETIFFLYLVPPILFESGYSLNHKDFFRNFTSIVLFSTAGTVISAVITGMSLFALAQHGYIASLDSVSPKEALLLGSLLSATDPVATLAVLGQLRVEPKLYSIIFGESVLNDAVAIVLFQTIERLPSATRFHISGAEAAEAMANFVGVGIGSVLLGAVVGLITAFITKRMLNKASVAVAVRASSEQRDFPSTT